MYKTSCLTFHVKFYIVKATIDVAGADMSPLLCSEMLRYFRDWELYNPTGVSHSVSQCQLPVYDPLLWRGGGLLAYRRDRNYCPCWELINEHIMYALLPLLNWLLYLRNVLSLFVWFWFGLVNHDMLICLHMYIWPYVSRFNLIKQTHVRMSLIIKSIICRYDIPRANYKLTSKQGL